MCVVCVVSQVWWEENRQTKRRRQAEMEEVSSCKCQSLVGCCQCHHPQLVSKCWHAPKAMPPSQGAPSTHTPSNTHAPECKGSKHSALVDNGACCDCGVKEVEYTVQQGGLPAHTNGLPTLAVARGAEAKPEALAHVLLLGVSVWECVHVKEGKGLCVEAHLSAMCGGVLV